MDMDTLASQSRCHKYHDLREGMGSCGPDRKAGLGTDNADQGPETADTVGVSFEWECGSMLP